MFHLLTTIVAFLGRSSLVSHSARSNGTSVTIEPSNVTEVLDRLFDSYDKHMRPKFTDDPVLVKVDMSVLSMGPISEQEMEMALDCYFRQYWKDERLKFYLPGLNTLSLNAMSFLQKIWKPDTYFKNGRRSYLHNLTVPNKLVRLANDGTIMVSQRLTIRVRCPMHLRKFPMDTQACPIIIGSLGHATDDIIYQWNKVSYLGDIKMSQYQLDGHLNSTRNVTSVMYSKGDFSTLIIHFKLVRQQGFYVLQIYVPCTMTVALSWVSFWINKEASPARVALGIMTVLTMSTFGLGGEGNYRSSLPRVSYSTALDLYVVACFGFVFAALVEYAVINFAHIIYLRKLRSQAEESMRRQSHGSTSMQFLSAALSVVPQAETFGGDNVKESDNDEMLELANLVEDEETTGDEAQEDPEMLSNPDDDTMFDDVALAETCLVSKMTPCFGTESTNLLDANSNKAIEMDHLSNTVEPFSPRSVSQQVISPPSDSHRDLTPSESGALTSSLLTPPRVHRSSLQSFGSNLPCEYIDEEIPELEETQESADELVALKPGNTLSSPTSPATTEATLRRRNRSGNVVKFQKGTRNVKSRSSREHDTEQSRIRHRKKLLKRWSDFQTGAATVVDKVDDLAKVLFPAAYMIFNALYWTAFLYFIPDEVNEELVNEYGTVETNTY